MPVSASVCVFCGAKAGASPRYAEQAAAVGSAIAAHGLTMIYGGGRVGLMGEVSRAALDAGAQVIGVIPQRLVGAEAADFALTRLEIVPDMPVRKTRMIELADAFLTLPGGLGTLDELFEVLTLGQIGYHAKPIALLNLDRFFDPLVVLGQSLRGAGFIADPHWAQLEILPSLDALNDWLRRQSRVDATPRTR